MATTEERLIDLKERRALYTAAEARVLRGQSYQLGQRMLTRANLAEIASEIWRLNEEINSLENGAGVFVQRIVPSDSL
jgi:hypothetical protein